MPFTVAAALTVVTPENKTILIAGFSAAIIGAITMGAGSHFVQKAEKENTITDSLLIALFYFIGGTIPLLPFILIDDVKNAFWISAIITLPILFIVGFLKGRLYSDNPLRSAIILFLTGVLAAGGAYLVAGLFM